MIHDTHSAQISQKQDERNLYAIMKTMAYHHNGFVATNYIMLLAELVGHSLVLSLSAMYNRTSCAQVHELPQSHCGDN